MNKNVYILSTWGIAFIAFLVIAIVCIGFIFAPVKDHIITAGEETVITWETFGLEGGGVIARCWREYPNYIIGLSTAAVLSLSGAVFSVMMIERLRREDKPEL